MKYVRGKWKHVISAFLEVLSSLGYRVYIGYTSVILNYPGFAVNEIEFQEFKFKELFRLLRG